MKLILIATVALGVSGCGNLPTQPLLSPISIKIEEVNFPTIGVITTAELGQALVDRGKMNYFLVADLKSYVIAEPAWGLSQYLEPQALRAVAEDSNWTYYRASKIKSKRIGDFGAIQNFEGVDAGLRISKEGLEVGFYSNYFGGALNATLSPQPEIKLRKVAAVDYPSFRQELIYNGRVKDSLKFLYRELSNDLMRPSFTQDIQYDISNSAIVGFKGVRLEVLDATNEMIRYKLLAPFS